MPRYVARYESYYRDFRLVKRDAEIYSRKLTKVQRVYHRETNSDVNPTSLIQHCALKREKGVLYLQPRDRPVKLNQFYPHR